MVGGVGCVLPEAESDGNAEQNLVSLTLTCSGILGRQAMNLNIDLFCYVLFFVIYLRGAVKIKNVPKFGKSP